jgi:hypothetical protein
MASPVATQNPYADRLESALGTLLLIHDREGQVRALDFHDFESRMRRLLPLRPAAGATGARSSVRTQSADIGRKDDRL